MPLNYAEKIVAEDVLVMAENSEEEPDPQQLNFWVPSVVNLRVAWPVDGGKTQAVFGLVVYRLSLC